MSLMSMSSFFGEDARHENSVSAIRSRLTRSSVVLIQEAAEVRTIPTTTEVIPFAKLDGVQITPSFIEFTDASEGLICRQKFTIKNVGTRPALIRIREPNSIAFQVKALKGGFRLNPGLSVSSSVTYSFKRPSFLRAIIPIEINEKVLDYRVICTLASERISIEPKSIDFGTIDIGYSSGLKIITINNEGGKSTRFSIDLGKNDLEITVKPLRGIVRPNRQVKLGIELIGINEGTFYSEFWIKSIPNIRVPLKVNIIVPKFVIYHPNTTGDFTLLDFPLTIENTRRYDTFVLRNISSQVSSYIVLGEVDNEIKCIRDIDRKKYPIYGVFQITPVEGRMGPFEGIIFEVEFAPTTKLMKWRKTLDTNSEADFMAFMRIIRVHCTETEDIIRIDSIRDDSDEPVSHRIQMQETIMETPVSSTSHLPTIESSHHDTMRICLHGEAQVAKLNFQPDAIYFGDLHVGEISQRVVRIFNSSTFAPLTFQLVPNAMVHCKPSSMKLKPNKAVEVSIKLIGKENVSSSFKIFFDAIVDSYDSTVSRRLEKVVVATYPMECSANILLKSRKIFDNLQSKEIILKTDKRLYWAAHLHTLSVHRKISVSIEEQDNEKIIQRILQFPKWKMKKQEPPKACQPIIEKSFISTAKAKVLLPLSPLQIYNVHISPTIFTFGSVAPKTQNYRQLIIENKNDFPVMIRLISLCSNCIHFPEGNLIILNSGSIISRLIEFRADHIGKFNGYIDYVVNDNHSFQLSITADVIYKELSLDKRDVVLGLEWFEEEAFQPLAAVVQIKNKLGARTCFKWEMSSGSGFFLEPISGSVRGNDTLYIYVYYEPDISKSHYTEAILKCESGSFSTLRISIPHVSPKVNFIEDNINLGEIPLNLTTKVKATLRNLDFSEALFEVDYQNLVRGCEVFPARGKIPPRGIFILDVHLTFDACFRFSTTIRVTVQGYLKLQLKLIGEVSFPKLKLSPQSIEAKRVSADAFQSHLITLTNLGATMFKVQFHLEEYSEFQICSWHSGKSSPIGVEGLIIPPGITQDFYLHFQPIDLASYAFYLPIIVNGILGPVLKNNPKTLNPVEFLKVGEEYYSNLSGFSITPSPSKLPTIFIDYTVAGHVVFFNKLLFHFDVSKDEVRDCLNIENRSTSRETSVLIRTDKFRGENSSFFIQWSSGVKPTLTETSIVCTLKSGESCIFDVIFKPKERGSFSVEAPIFIRGELEGKMFNKLRLDGENPKACIGAETSEIFFPPIPPRVSIEEKFKLQAKYFEKPPVVSWTFSIPEIFHENFKENILRVDFPGGNSFSVGSYVELEVKIRFYSEKPISFCITILFEDDRKIAVLPIKIYAIADDNLLTIHAYRRKSIENFREARNSEKKISYSSATSESETDDGDNEDSQQTIFPRKNIPYAKASTFSVDGLSKPSLGKTELNDDISNNIFQFKGDSKYSVGSGSKSPRFSGKLSFPFYPINGSNDDYERHMERTVSAVEQWLYSGPFKFNYYANIPAGITKSFLNLSVRRKSRNSKMKNHFFEGSIVTILESLVGSNIYDFIGKPQPLPEDDIPRIEYILKLYDKIINFLISQGASIPHISSQFLLCYDDYTIIMESKRKEVDAESICDRMTKQLFESRSKQCWVDLILQTYKCFVLTKISENQLRKKFGESIPGLHMSRRSTMITRESVSSIMSTPRYFEIHERTIQSIIQLANVRSLNSNYSSHEIFLLSWLQHHYGEQLVQDWMKDRRLILNPEETNDVTVEKTIENFDNDLSDSLVLMAVTAAYCPFLIEEYFNNIYISPRTNEELLHNAICVVSAWRKIRLGFLISPMQIVNPNCVQMLFLTGHLFGTLPTYTPRARIRFNCPLSETVTRQMSLTNPTDYGINYLVLFIGNDNGFFTLLNPTAIVKVNGRDSVQIRIQFHARKIRKIKAYLVLCGSSTGPHFGRNQTFILEGQADSLGITNEYILKSKLYQIVERTLIIDVPYESEAEYEIWMTEERPSKPSTLKMSRWSELRFRKIPRRLFLNQKSMVVAEGARQAHLSITFACISPRIRSFWLIFQSKAGDFIIQIDSKWQTSITDRIVIEWSPGTSPECICSDPKHFNSLCPFTIIIPIPSKNSQLWNCVANMFQKTLDLKERQFWSRYLNTHIGLRLIHWLMGDSTDVSALEFSHIFNIKVEYNVSVSEKSGLLLSQDNYVIRDVTSSESNELMTGHVAAAVPNVYEVALSLLSKDDREIRVYTLFILRTSPRAD